MDEAVALILDEGPSNEDDRDPEFTVIPPDPDGLTDEENIDDEELEEINNELDPSQDIAGTIEVHIPSEVNSKKRRHKEKTKWN